MFRTLRTLSLVVGLLGLVGSSKAQDPATQRPGQPSVSKTSIQQPAPAQNQVPLRQQQAPAAAPQTVANQQAVGVFHGTEDLQGMGPLTFKVFADGVCEMIDSTKKPVRGHVRAEGNRGIFTFSNCVYEGVEQGNSFVGTARFTSGPATGRAWNFRVTLQSPVQGRSFVGTENLANYGAVTFRFVDGNTVEMIDKDGVTRGSYTYAGLQITMTFGGAVYTGMVRGNTFDGNARNQAQGFAWTFTSNQK